MRAQKEESESAIKASRKALDKVGKKLKAEPWPRDLTKLKFQRESLGRYVIPHKENMPDYYEGRIRQNIRERLDIPEPIDQPGEAVKEK